MKQARIMFHTTKDLRARVEILPSVPEWRFKSVSLTGYSTQEPTLLFYRDALECVEYLFRNPTFTDRIDFRPVRLYRNSEQTTRLYTEWMTGNTAWEMQVRTYISTFFNSMHRPYPPHRKCFQMERHSLASSSPRIRPTYQ